MSEKKELTEFQKVWQMLNWDLWPSDREDKKKEEKEEQNERKE